MKTVFLSIILLIYGYFCDICRVICQKSAEGLIKRGKPLTKKSLVCLGNFTERRFSYWKKLERKFIYLLASERTF